MATFSFPILNNSEIIKCLAELDITLNEEDLKKPTMESMKPIYEQIVQMLMGVTREELYQPNFQAVDVLEFPELHDDAIGILAFNRAITKLMFAGGVNDFTLRDLHKPEYVRTRRNLSATINFAKFREEKMAAYQEFQDQSDQMLERKQQLEDVNVQVNAELQRIEAERANEQPSIVALTQETEGLQKTILDLHKQNNQITGEIKSLEKKSGDLTDKVKQTVFALGSAEQERAKLTREIVESPDKIQHALRELHLNVERERTAVGDYERRARDMQTKIDCTAKVEREISKCLAAMQDADAEIKKYKEASKLVKDVKAKMTKNEEETQSLRNEVQYLKRQEKSLQDRLQKFEQQAAAKKEAGISSLRELQETKDTTAREYGVADARVADIHEKMADLQKRLTDKLATYDREAAAVRAKQEALLQQVKRYHNAVRATMERPPSLPPRPALAS